MGVNDAQTDLSRPAGRPATARVLIALDGSAAAAAALPFARALAAALQLPAEVIYAAAKPTPMATIREQLGLGDGAQGDLSLQVAVGEPAAAIVGGAAAPEVGLLVMATHGGSIHSHPGLGSIARAVAASTPVPLLLVRPEAEPPAGRLRRPLHRLLLPLDADPQSLAGLAPAAGLARRLGAAVDLLHVTVPGPAPAGSDAVWRTSRYSDAPYYDWDAWERGVRRHVVATVGDDLAALRLRIFRERGDAARAIARFARRHGEDLIVLVRSGPLKPGRTVVLQELLAVAPRPVLLLAQGMTLHPALREPSATVAA